MGWTGLGNVVSALIDQQTDVGMGLFNDYRSRKSAKKAYERQLEFSNSAHQREVQDLIAAGLNPVLSAGGNGAAGVTVAQSGSPNMHRSSSYGQAINSALLMRNQNKLLEAQKSQAESIAAANTANAELTNAKTVAQGAENIIEVAKSDFFKRAPKELKENLINALMYPDSMVGQARGLTDRIGQHAHKTTNKFFDVIDRLFFQGSDSGSQGGHKDAGSQGGHNSARKVKDSSDRREKASEFIERLEREQKKEREIFRKNYPKGRIA